MEEVSIVASKQERDKPRTIDRPGQKRKSGGFAAMIAAAAGRVRRG